MLTAAQDLPQVAEQYPDQKDSGLSHPRIAYERFVQQVSSFILLVSPILHLYDYADTFDLLSRRPSMFPLSTLIRKSGQAQASYGAFDGLRCLWRKNACMMHKLDLIKDVRTLE